MSEPTAVQIALKADVMRSDLVRGLVWFVNYAAIDPSSVSTKDLDLHGAAMLPEDVEKFAHRWLAFSRSVDIEHDGIGRNVHVVASFFNDQNVQASAWPINSHAVQFDVSGDKEAFDGLRSGRLNSVSLDAYTFNRVVRLPVAEAQKMVGMQSKIDPDTISDWASELVRMGYSGVTRVRKAADGVYIAERDSGLPVAVSVKNGSLEASAAGGAWGHLAAALVESPTLELKAIGPEIDIDYSLADQAGGTSVGAWDPRAVRDMLSKVGINLEDTAYEQFRKLTEDAYSGTPGSTAHSCVGPDPDQTTAIPTSQSEEGSSMMMGEMPGGST